MPKGDGVPGSGWFDKEAWKDHISYPQNPVRSIGQLNRLLGEMRAVLPKLKLPVLLIHSKDDDYVLPENLELIYSHLNNVSDKTKFYITGSGHVITRDASCQQVFEQALDFIQRIESSGE
jgi:carboxylesterase